MVYTIQKETFLHVAEHQRNEMLSDFVLNGNGDIEIEYEHKGYTCNDLEVNNNSRIKAISMFSGAGGLDIGTQLAGVPVLTSLDIFEDSVNTMRQNTYFKNTTHECGDINQINGKHYSEVLKRENPEKLIIVGGPPCQPFSKAGYWVTNEKRNSSEDPRNLIVPYFKIISEIKPDGFVLENVESILHPSNKEAIDTIAENMDKLGYRFSALKINAAEYGIPQKRKRVFFLASKKNIKAELKATHGSTEECKRNPGLLPYERVIDWIGKFDNPSIWKDENLSTEGKWEKELKCVPFGRNYIALSARAGYPNPVFEAGKRYWLSLLKLHPLLPSWTIIAITMNRIKKVLISLLLVLCLTVNMVDTASASITVATIAIVGAIGATVGTTVAALDSNNQYNEVEPREGMFDSWLNAKTSVAYSSGLDKEWAYGNQQKEFSTTKPCYVRVGSSVQAPWHWGWWWGEGHIVTITYRLIGVNTCDVEVSDGFLTNVESNDPNVLIFTKTIKAKKDHEEEVIIFKYTPKGIGSLSLEVHYDEAVKSEYDVKNTAYFVDDSDY